MGDDNKVEDVVKTDKEVMGKEEEEKTEPKKVHLLQKLFGKRKDFVVPKIDEVAKTDKEIINEEEKTEEKTEEEEEEKKDEEKKDEEEKKDDENKEGEEAIEEAS